MKKVDKIATIAACAIFVALYVLVLAQMLGRSVGVSLLFAEDLISILFIWFVMGGAVVAYIYREHLEVDLLHERLAPRLRRSQQRLWIVGIRLAELVFLGVFAYALVLMAGKTWNAHYGALPGFRYGYLYVGVLVAMVACMVIVIRHLILDLRADAGK